MNHLISEGQPTGVPPSPRTARWRALRSAVVAGASAAMLLGSAVSPAIAAPAAPAASVAPIAAPAAPAAPSALPVVDCTGLSGFTFEDTVISATEIVPAGTLTNRGEPIGEHCLVRGQMNQRVSEVDGQSYAIGFEMRLPMDWNGRYLYQGNGGLDGAIAPAVGRVGGGENGLQMGMAVISSDAGHNGSQNPRFGLDPQARLDYGYQAVGTLTPMAKALVEEAYGQAPHHSYITGGSNGGRHTMVAASRYTDEYDGFLALAPGFNLPQAALAQIWGAQQWDTVATAEDLNTALTLPERQVLAASILEACDDLDGLADGLVQASDACQEVFSVEHDVPTCDGERDGSCLSTEQKAVVAEVFAGATTSDGSAIYVSFPYDPGLVQPGWADWKFNAPINRDSAAIGFIFSSPPYAPALNALREFVMTLDIDEANERIYATSGPYAESAMEFMTPTDLDFQALKTSGGKMMVIHGASDGVFSMDDTTDWYQQLEQTHGGDASEFVQYFQVPGMGHVSGGPATDQHNALATIVDWVEAGERPDRLEAWVNPANTQIPAGWSSDRSRPLCAYPSVAVYLQGDPESAESFECLEMTEVPDFVDNQPGTRYYEPIRWLQLAGITGGYADGTFRKDRDITRAESLAFIYRYVQPDSVVSGAPFPDVPANHSFVEPISWAKAEHITGGYADGLFKPARSVTRGEFASFLYRTMDPDHLGPEDTEFKDVSVTSTHYEAITWLASEGLSVGYRDGTYRPDQHITRGEAATLMYRYEMMIAAE